MADEARLIPTIIADTLFDGNLFIYEPLGLRNVKNRGELEVDAGYPIISLNEARVQGIIFGVPVYMARIAQVAYFPLKWQAGSREEAAELTFWVGGRFGGCR